MGWWWGVSGRRGGGRGNHPTPPSAWAASSWHTYLLFLPVMPAQSTQWRPVHCPLVLCTWKSVGIISLTTSPEQSVWGPSNLHTPAPPTPASFSLPSRWNSCPHSCPGRVLRAIWTLPSPRAHVRLTSKSRHSLQATSPAAVSCGLNASLLVTRVIFWQQLRSLVTGPEALPL